MKTRIEHYVKEIKPLFPRVRWVWVYTTHKTDFYMAVRQVWPYTLVWVDRVCRKMPDNVIKYLIAHEFAHVQYPQYNERDIDIKLIELGFKDDLIAFHKWHNKKYRKYRKKDGLTLSKIKKHKKKYL